MRNLIGLSLGLFCSLALADPTLTEDHEDWSSLIRQDGDQMWFQATTVKLQKGMMSGLTLDRSLEDCDSLGLTVTFGLKSPSEVNVQADNHLGQMRVDEAPIRNIIFAISLLEGDDTVYLKIENADRLGTLLDEFIMGRTVRFKFSLRGDETLYFNFSLMGATAAIVRADTLCREYQDIDPDKRYFDDEGPRKKSDEEYFDA